MTLAQYFKPALLLVSFLTGMLLPKDIVTRHDKNDSDYIKLGAQFPAVGKVGKRGGDGTLIESKWVLTAAHVAAGMQRRYGTNFKVYFEGYPEGIEIEHVYVHPQFMPMQGHDIALLKLKTSITDIPPLGLYERQNEVGKDIVIVGHGDFKKGNETEWSIDRKKRAATNRIESVTNDHIRYRFDSPGSESTTDLEGTAGRGDSGGPALIQKDDVWLIAGVSSAGMPGENGPGTYGAIEHYTRVSSHLKWLQQVLTGKVESTIVRTSPVEGGDRVVVQRGPGASPGFPGLGLILNQGNGKIVIDGKIDPEVPAAFRNVVFGPTAYIESFNGVKVKELKKFKEAFASVKSGEEYIISFSIKGEMKAYKSIKR